MNKIAYEGFIYLFSLFVQVTNIDQFFIDIAYLLASKKTNVSNINRLYLFYSILFYASKSF